MQNSTYFIDGETFTYFKKNAIDKQQHQVQFFASPTIGDGQHTLHITNYGNSLLIDYLEVVIDGTETVGSSLSGTAPSPSKQASTHTSTANSKAASTSTSRTVQTGTQSVSAGMLSIISSRSPHSCHSMNVAVVDSLPSIGGRVRCPGGLRVRHLARHRCLRLLEMEAEETVTCRFCNPLPWAVQSVLLDFSLTGECCRVACCFDGLGHTWIEEARPARPGPIPRPPRRIPCLPASI